MNSSSAPDPASAGRPLRLVVTNTSRSWGGMEHYAVQLAAGLARRGHAVTLLWGHAVVGERAAAAGLANARWRPWGDADLPAVAALAAGLRRARADAVILTRWREYLLGGVAARLAGTPLTVSALGLRVTPRNDCKRRFVFRLSQRVLVNAEEIRAGLVERPWIAPDKVCVVHNGVDLASLRPGGDRRPMRRLWGVPAEAPLALAVGGLTPQKDHDLLARAAARLRGPLPEARVVVVGEGFLRPALEARVGALGLADRFLLPGFLPDVRPALAAADLLVLSSDNEGMAWVLLEALACGLPIVATDVPGVRACVEPGVNGLIVPPRDEAALAGALAELLADPARCRAMGERSRALAEARFAEEGMLAGTEAVLREALAAPRR
ncbi:MAG: glycosyltransferase family 4 protein [Candidatus Krumholzibacteriia bacterium]